MTTELSPISILSLLNSNKSQRNSFCLHVVEKIENGEADPLQIHVFLKNLEQIFKTLTDEKTGKDLAIRYRSSLIDAAEKEDGNNFEKFNAKFQIKETGVKYDWAICGDPERDELEEMQKEIELLIRDREKFLKTIPEGGIIVTDPETGETKRIYRPAKSSTTSVNVSLD